MGYDLLVLVMLCFATLRGAQKGFVWQLAAILALIVCFGFSGTLSAQLAPLMPGEPPLNRWIAMFVLYLGFSFVAFGVARQLRGWMEKVKFVEYDRHLGAVFGFIKGGIFSLVVTFFAVTLSGSLRETVLHSNTGYLSAFLMERVNPMLSADMRQALAPYTRGLDRQELDQLYAQQTAAAQQAGVDGKPAAAPPKIPLIAEFLSNLPKSYTDADRKLAETALQNSEGTDRTELMKELKTSKPEEFRSLAREWRNGRPRRRRSERNGFDRNEPPRASDNREGTVAGPGPFQPRANDPLNSRDPREESDPFPSNAPPRDPGLSRTNTPPRSSNDPPRLSNAPRSNDPPSRSRDPLNDPAFDEPPVTRRSVVGNEPTRTGVRPASSSEPRRNDARWEPPVEDPYDDPFAESGFDRRQVAEPAATRDGADERDRRDLIDEIAAEYSNDDDQRLTLRDEFTSALRGLPAGVVLAVLRDWNSDLKGQRPDTDSGTTHRTSLDVRIVRQMSSAKIPLSTLDSALQDRLDRSSRR